MNDTPPGQLDRVVADGRRMNGRLAASARPSRPLRRSSDAGS